jgi:4-aminobutyrate aminotransferase-like enzyme/Ser/Thr protein kinase RdoA (MazF antagonist)
MIDRSGAWDYHAGAASKLQPAPRPVHRTAGSLRAMAQTAADSSVLDSPPPRFTPAEVADIAATLFGVRGEARDLGSERDQTFMIDDGGDGGVIKVSNLGEQPDALDLETVALETIARADPTLPIARPLRPAGAGDDRSPAAYRPTTEGPGGAHFVRMFERRRGRSVTRGTGFDDGAVRDFGATLARIGAALHGYFHPAAGRVLLWDTKHALGLRRHLHCIDDTARRALVARVLDHYEERAVPAWPRLRAQVVHGDLALDNVLLDDRDRVSGIVDFGDIVHTALVSDIAASMASMLRGRTGADVLRTARILLDGYASRTPLLDAELEVMAAVLAARLATIVTISAWRVRDYPENAEYIQAWDDDSWTLLEELDATGLDAVASALGAPRPPAAAVALARRRDRIVGPALTGLTYAEPVHVARGEGPWLFDASGRRLLDAYNNVPVVGHCHPRVTEAVVRQTRRLNTHARYLYEPLVELGERLAAAMPAGSGLDAVMLLNSGSEANDLAWRIATAATGNAGALVTPFAYHGMTTVVADLSPEDWTPRGERPAHVETFAVPAGGEPAAPGAGVRAEAETAAAVERLAARGIAPAAVYLDCGFTSDGILIPPEADVAAAVAVARAAGAVVVADEVQAGHGRTGEGMWSFPRYGLQPDIVTLGKPMGNGYPVAALIARRDLLEAFADRVDFFSTFGGNPVACVAALAVLDVIEDEGLVARAARVGEELRAAVAGLGPVHDALGAVRGRGLLVGAEIVTAAGEPDPDRAAAVMNAMRAAGVLVGRTGPAANVLKIRPPLAFAGEHVGILAGALDGALAEAER